MKYYEKKALFLIAEKVGKPIRVDYNTNKAAKGKYDRVCVEINLDKH